MRETRSQTSQTAITVMSDDLAERVQALESKVDSLPGEVQAALAAQQTAITDRLDAFLAAQEARQRGHRDDEAQGHAEIPHRGPHQQQQVVEYTPPSRQTKIYFPRFQRHDIEGWLHSCEHYFEIDNTPGSWKVRLAKENLDARAYIWHLAFEEEEEGRPISWQRYKQAMRVRFGPLKDVKTSRMPTLNMLGSTQNGSSVVGTMEEATEKSKEMKMNFARSKFPTADLVSEFCNPKCPKAGDGIDELSRFEALGNSLSASSLSLQVERESCGSAKATTLVCDSAKRMTSVSAPSSSLASSLFESEVIAPARDVMQANGNSCISARKEKARDSETDLAHTWVSKGQFERSNIAVQLGPIINSRIQELTQQAELQSEKFRGQLVPIFLVSDECMGFVFQEIGPKLLLSWFLPNRPTRSFYNWVFLIVAAARCLVLSWFRGELIKMLYGSSCSLSSKKKKGKTLGCSSTENQFGRQVQDTSFHAAVSFKCQQKFQNLTTSAYVYAISVL